MDGSLNRMFLDTFTHALDDKDRVSVPSKYKKVLTELSPDDEAKYTLVLTAEEDKCITVYPGNAYEEFSKKFLESKEWDKSKQDRDQIRRKGGYSKIVKIDKAGRIIIPKNLKGYAEIDKDVVFVGVYDRFEIWGKEKYEKEYGKI
ncbi:MAG: division/cell wall cluster transcriptional repressor MraZ [bacterium]